MGDCRKVRQSQDASKKSVILTWFFVSFPTKTTDSKEDDSTRHLYGEGTAWHVGEEAKFKQNRCSHVERMSLVRGRSNVPHDGHALHLPTDSFFSRSELTQQREFGTKAGCGRMEKVRIIQIIHVNREL